MKAGTTRPSRKAHAGAVGVEDADDLGVDFVLAVVGHGHGFGEALGLVINAARADGVDVAPVGLRLGMDERVAVALGGGGEEEGGLFGLGRPRVLWVPWEPTLRVGMGCSR